MNYQGMTLDQVRSVVAWGIRRGLITQPKPLTEAQVECIIKRSYYQERRGIKTKRPAAQRLSHTEYMRQWRARNAKAKCNASAA